MYRNLPFCIFLTELSSSSDNGSPRPRDRIPHVVAYSNQYGDLEPVSNFTPQRLAANERFIFGVIINDGIYPFFNFRREQVLVNIHNGVNVVMTPELRERYGRIYAPFLPRPSN